MSGMKRLLLALLACVYGSVTDLRNCLYDHGVLKITRFGLPVISVGNLVAGGTGKTPHVIEIARLLVAKGYKVAVLSRGFGRSDGGFIAVKDESRAHEVGDEPVEIKRALGENALVVVDADRVSGVRKLLTLEPQLDVVLLDDGFQHRRLDRSLNILLTDYGRLYVDDELLPLGRLRERKRGADRADIVVVTKCPHELSQAERRDIRRRLGLGDNQQLFFSHIVYSDIPPAKRVLVVCGIANPRPLIDRIASTGVEVSTLCFPDHHAFTRADAGRIRDAADSVDLLLTTAKDAPRLAEISGWLGDVADKLRVVAMRVEVDDREFNQKIIRHVEENRPNRRVAL